MTCQRCGQELRDDARFCDRCGADMRGMNEKSMPERDENPPVNPFVDITLDQAARTNRQRMLKFEKIMKRLTIATVVIGLCIIGVCAYYMSILNAFDKNKYTIHSGGVTAVDFEWLTEYQQEYPIEFDQNITGEMIATQGYPKDLQDTEGACLLRIDEESDSISNSIYCHFNTSKDNVIFRGLNKDNPVSVVGICRVTDGGQIMLCNCRIIE